jgi:hypothetical protein
MGTDRDLPAGEAASTALACSLPPNALPARRAEIQTLFKNRIGSTVQPDGVELTFAVSEEAIQTLLDFILFERRCCKTFTYELCFAPPHDAVTLRLTAPAEQVASLQALYRDLI